MAKLFPKTLFTMMQPCMIKLLNKRVIVDLKPCVQVSYPNMVEFFETLGVDMEISDMSFSVSLDEGKGCEWGSRNGLSSLFAQKTNALNPSFWRMIREIVKFKGDVLM